MSTTMDYNPLNVVTEDEDIELDLDEALDEAVNEAPPEIPQDSPEEPSTDSDDSDDVDNSVGLIVVIWVLIIIAIVTLVAFSIFKKKDTGKTKVITETQTVYVNDNLILMPGLKASQNVETDTVVITRYVSTLGNTVVPYFSGTLSSTGELIYIEVPLDTFNNTEDGTKITVSFSRLKIKGQEHLVVRSWK